MIDNLLYMLTGILATVIGILVRELVIEPMRRPKVGIDELETHRFSSSIRLQLLVAEESGKSAARDCTPYLTVTLYRDCKGSTSLPKDLTISKPSGRGDLEVKTRWDYLVPVSDTSFSIVKEALPWSIPKTFGSGLGGYSYCYVADIPAKGYNRVLLMDIYKVKSPTGNNCYVVRIFSEYGTEVYPRAVLILPINNTPQFSRLEFEVHVSCAKMQKAVERRLSELTRGLKTDSDAMYCCEQKEVPYTLKPP